MKKMTLLLALALSLSAQAGPRVVGNGGGGIYENGIYKTFYSAGVLVNPKAETEVPGLSLLHETILAMTNATRIFPAYLPSGKRKYFNIIESDMNIKNIERLLEEYRRVVGQGDNIAIFAVTDIADATTYLLPSFYELTEREQAAILFHEAYWLLRPQATYHDVVSAEISFQEYLEKGSKNIYSPDFPRLLANLLGDEFLSLRTAFNYDVKNNIAPNIITKDGIKINDLYANECSWQYSFFKRNKKISGTYYGLSTYDYGYTPEGDYIECKKLWKGVAQAYYLDLQRKYPRSHFFKEMMNMALESTEYIIESKRYETGTIKRVGRDMRIEFSNMSEREYQKLKNQLSSILDNYKVKF